mgnify:CR=1 FL=1
MNIHRARELVEGRKDFIIVEKDGYTVADYVFMSNDTFDELERHELRGLKFDNKTGEILARPFHKFFNIGEKEEHANIDWSRPHVVMPKLDGSMIHAALVNNEVRLMTRMGITEHSIRAERHLTDVLKKELLIELLCGQTPIFEWTAPDNQIVLPYDESKLTLLANRNNETGKYDHPELLKDLSILMEVDCIDFDEPFDLETSKNNLGIEGYVIWFYETGEFYKVKTDEYVMMHRAVSFFDREDKVLACVLEGKCDDLYPALDKERADKLKSYENDVNSELINLAATIEVIAVAAKSYEMDRKTFALKIVNQARKSLRSAYFRILDGDDALDAVKKCVYKDPMILNRRWV